MIYPEDDGKGHGTDLIVDNEVETTLIINKGKEAEGFFINDGTVTDTIFTDNDEFKNVLTIINHLLLEAQK